jgi:hypothetical protein
MPHKCGTSNHARVLKLQAVSMCIVRNITEYYISKAFIFGKNFPLTTMFYRWQVLQYLTVILRTRVEYELIADVYAPHRLSLIFDESEWNNCFIIYTRSEFTDFAFRIFSIFFYFVYVFIFALSAEYFFKNMYF